MGNVENSVAGYDNGIMAGECWRYIGQRYSSPKATAHTVADNRVTDLLGDGVADTDGMSAITAVVELQHEIG